MYAAWIVLLMLKWCFKKKKLRHTVGYRQRKEGLADVTDAIVPLSVDSLWKCGEAKLT